MAIGDDYLTLGELKSYMGLETSGKDAEVGDAISSASREIERHTRRQFNDAGTVSARRYRAGNCHAIAVDDFWTETGFKLEIDVNSDGTWVEVPSTEYELTPYDRLRDGLPWVFWRIEMVSGTKLPITRRAGVRVTARWGWEAVPPDVKQAVKMLASDTFQIKDSRMGVAGSDQFGTIVRVQKNSLVDAKLKNFVRGRVFVA